MEKLTIEQAQQAVDDAWEAYMDACSDPAIKALSDARDVLSNCFYAVQAAAHKAREAMEAADDALEAARHELPEYKAWIAAQAVADDLWQEEYWADKPKLELADDEGLLREED